MTSMAELLGEASPSLAEVRRAVTGELVSLLGYAAAVEVPAEAARAFQNRPDQADDVRTGNHPGIIPPFAGGQESW